MRSTRLRGLEAAIPSAYTRTTCTAQPRLGAVDAIDFDQFVNLLRGRIGAADAIEGNHELHSFRELMADYADVTPDKWYWDAFKELDAQGHLSPTSRVAKGGDANARLSDDGRLYLGEVGAAE